MAGPTDLPAATTAEERSLFGATVRYAGGLHDLGDGVHAWLQPNGSWGESNAGLVVGDGASLLIDTLWDLRLTRRMLDAMAPLAGAAPITHVVNTHSDGDHWWGNELVAGAEIVTSRRSVEIMATQSPGEMARFAALGRVLRLGGGLPLPRRGTIRCVGEYVGGVLAPYDFSALRLTPATRTFAGELALEVGGLEARLIEVGPAHTPGDLIVHLPWARTLFTADVLFIGSTPVMWAGPVENWIAALDRILALDAQTIVPGHGPLATAADVHALRDYWTWLDGAARERFAAGQPAHEAARELALGADFRARPFAAWECPERIVVNVRTLYGHYRCEHRPPGPRDLIDVFSRMALLARDLRAAGVPGSRPVPARP